MCLLSVSRLRGTYTVPNKANKAIILGTNLINGRCENHIITTSSTKTPSFLNYKFISSALQNRWVHLEKCMIALKVWQAIDISLLALIVDPESEFSPIFYLHVFLTICFPSPTISLQSNRKDPTKSLHLLFGPMLDFLISPPFLPKSIRRVVILL